MDRGTINLRRDLYEKVEQLAEKSGQPRTAIVDALVEYALLRASVRTVTNIIFSDEPAANTTTLALQDAWRNGATSAAIAPQNPVESKPKLTTRSSRPVASGLERRERLLDIVKELNRPVTAMELRYEYRRVFKDDTGNINSLLDTIIRTTGAIHKDIRVMPYRFTYVPPKHVEPEPEA